MEQEHITRLKELLTTQPLAVLSTSGEGQPYASLVAFCAADDLARVLFATPRTTRKYRNLLSRPQAALLVDNRSNRVTDVEEAMAVTILGIAHDAEGEERRAGERDFLRKHPHLDTFVRAPDSALVVLTVQKMVVVSHFQEVEEVRPPVGTDTRSSLLPHP